MVSKSDNSDYSQKTLGYGRLTEAQTAQVKESKGKIEESKKHLLTYVNTVQKLSDDRNIGKLLTDVVAARQEAKESKELTKAQKKFLTNVKEDVETLKIEIKTFEKREVKDLERDLKKTEVSMQKDLKKLEHSSDKVEKLAKMPQFGRSNFIFGVSKESRVRSASNEEKKAGNLKEKASIETETLQGRAVNTQQKISQFQVKSNILGLHIQNRMTALKDVHVSIRNAKNEREQLIAKYKYKKNEFANLNTPSKMSAIDKKEFKNQLDAFDKQIQVLEKLEKKLSNQGISKGGEEKLLQDIKGELESVKRNMGKISSAILIVIEDSQYNDMNFSERIFLVSSKLFEVDSEKLNKQERRFLEEQYPGIDPKIAFKMHEEALTKEIARTRESQLFQKPADSLKEPDPSLTADEALSPHPNLTSEFDGPPTDLPPELEGYKLANPSLQFPPTDLPPELEAYKLENPSLHFPPTDLPPELPEMTKGASSRPIRARQLPGNRPQYNALNPRNPSIDE